MFVPISSTNTTERASSDWATITFQAALRVHCKTLTVSG
jgi:hypothetical protein